jgi:hypothetical protein
MREQHLAARAGVGVNGHAREKPCDSNGMHAVDAL